MAQKKFFLKYLYNTSDCDYDNYSIESISSTMSIDENTESGDNFITKRSAIHDCLLIKYTRKKTLKRFICQNFNISEDGLSINLLK